MNSESASLSRADQTFGKSAAYPDEVLGYSPDFGAAFLLVLSLGWAIQQGE